MEEIMLMLRLMGRMKVGLGDDDLTRDAAGLR
jgi:hypothetical protein